MATINNTVSNYAEEVVAYMDKQAKMFLKKNAIPFNNIEETQAFLRERGYRLIDEQESKMIDDRKHTLLLVKIIDQTSYVIKAPKIELGEQVT